MTWVCWTGRIAVALICLLRGALNAMSAEALPGRGSACHVEGDRRWPPLTPEIPLRYRRTRRHHKYRRSAAASLRFLPSTWARPSREARGDQRSSQHMRCRPNTPAGMWRLWQHARTPETNPTPPVARRVLSWSRMERDANRESSLDREDEGGAASWASSRVGCPPLLYTMRPRLHAKAFSMASRLPGCGEGMSMAGPTGRRIWGPVPRHGPRIFVRSTRGRGHDPPLGDGLQFYRRQGGRPDTRVAAAPIQEPGTGCSIGIQAKSWLVLASSYARRPVFGPCQLRCRRRAPPQKGLLVGTASAPADMIHLLKRRAVSREMHLHKAAVPESLRRSGGAPLITRYVRAANGLSIYEAALRVPHLRRWTFYALTCPKYCFRFHHEGHLQDRSASGGVGRSCLRSLH